ncbi:MAG: family 16 glycosylhydrolase, partial [Acutalibacteraceae bacterium]
GNLVLTAREETRYNTTAKKEGYKYISSGEVTTGGKAAFKYGLIEVRAKLPKGQGVYPAICTMGYDYDVGSCNWPWSGEIDIMEAVGKGDTDDKNTDTWQTLHYAKQNSENMSHTAAHLAKSVGKYATADSKALNDDYHNFWVYFDNKVLIIGVDETMMKIMDLTTDELRAFAEYEQFLILGLQMGGGTATGDIAVELTKDSVWEMLVDYVRVYQLDDDSKYDDYRIFEAESFNTDSDVGGATSLCSRDCVKASGTKSLNSVITGLEAGTYDIYGAITTSTSESTYEPYIQGEKVDGVTISTYEDAPDGDTPYIGTVKLEDNLPFELVLKNTKAATNTTNLEIDKYFFVKSDATPNVVINSDNCYKASDRIEVSTADELLAALSEVDFDGTVAVTDDITLTKNLTITKNLTLDLGGHTINTGTLSKPFSINSQGATVKFQNGDFIVNGNSGVIQSFVALDQKSTAVEFDNINVDFKAYKYSKVGYVFIGSPYASGGKTITVNNSNFKFTGTNTDLGAYQYYLCGTFGATTVKLYNSAFSGNSALNLIYTESSNSGYSKGFIFKNCNIDSFGIVFNGKDDINSSNNPIKLAQTNITNCVSLANSDTNASKFLAATNNTIYKADNTEIESADITNDIGTVKYVCTHEYNDATCTSPKTCKYCSLSEGEPLGHTPGEAEVTDGDCLHDSVSTVKCTTCGEIISSEVVSKAEGHSYTIEKIDEDSCTLLVQNDVTSTSPDNPSFKRDGVHFAKYYRRTCTKCGHVETYSGTNGRAYGSSGHTVDPDSVVEFNDCKLGHGYYYTCAVCGETNIKKTLTLGKHNLVVDSITEPTETEDGVINYKCTECDYTEQSKAIPYGTHYVTIDGVKYPAIDNFFVTPYCTDSSFVGYFDGTKLIDGNQKLNVTEDITLESVKLSLEMLRGASIRYSNPTGLRYYTDIDKTALEKLEAMGATVQLGTLICPKDILSFEDLRLDMQGENINVLYDSREWYIKGDFSGFVGSITDIKSENITREYVGRGYATVTLGDYTKTVYADYKNAVERNNTRTISYIADCIKNSDTYNNLADFKKEIIDSLTKK